MMWRLVTVKFFKTKFGRQSEFNHVDKLSGEKLRNYECHKVSKVVIAASWL